MKAGDLFLHHGYPAIYLGEFEVAGQKASWFAYDREEGMWYFNERSPHNISLDANIYDIMRTIKNTEVINA